MRKSRMFRLMVVMFDWPFVMTRLIAPIESERP